MVASLEVGDDLTEIDKRRYKLIRDAREGSTPRSLPMGPLFKSVCSDWFSDG